MNDREMPRWERRFRAPTAGFPTWSRHAPDRLVYVSNESGSFQAYGFDVATGATRRVSQSPIGIDNALPSADGADIVWFDDLTGDESGHWVAVPFDGGRPQALVPELDDGWPAGLALGLKAIVVGRSDRDGHAIHASIDGEPPREIYRSRESATVAGTFERKGSNLGGLSADEGFVCIEHAERGDEVRRALRVFEVLSGEVVADEWDGPDRGLVAEAWSPVAGDARLAIRHERADRERPAVWDVESGTRRDIDVDLPGDVVPLDWWPDASALLVVHFFDGRHQLFRCQLDGAIAPIEHPEGTLDEARVRPDGDVWMEISSGGSPPRALSRHGHEVIVTAERPPEGVPFESWDFENEDGDRVHGFVAAPGGDGPFPVIMHVHGGPTSSDRDAWNPQVQAFVDHGYVVGLVNYRGSSGYGRMWRDSIIGNIGLPEESDVVAGLNDLVARGLADPERAVIGGWSWGGYVTLLSIGRRPERWRAALAGVPVGDYAAGYDELSPELQAYDRYLLGGKTPHDVPELMAERSPIAYVDRVSTPTLVLVARNDTRCPYGQAMAWVDAVRANGGDVEVYEYDTGHSSYDVDELVRQLRKVIDFLGRHVRSK